MRRASRALTQLYDDLMAPSGLRITQFSLLRTLARNGAARMSDLAATLLLDRTALSRTLDPLALRGLWGSFFSRSHEGKAMRRIRGVFSRIALVAGSPIAPAQATPERLQDAVLALRGDRR